MANSGKFYLTTPIYYVNAAPHIGSAYPTIAADVLARWHRAQGDDTFFLTGTDEHGAKIAAAAAEAGKAPQAFADEISQQFASCWSALNIKPDDFIRTTAARHKEAVGLFLRKLKDSGQLYEGEYEGLYCVGHEAFIKEADVVNGRCPDHQTKPELLKEKNWFFKLSAYGEEIQKKIESGEFIIAPASRRNEVLAFIERGLEDIAISRPNVKWGIPLPWDKNQTVYVWVEALFNYCSAIGYSQSFSPPARGVDQEGVGAISEKGFDYWWPADLHLVGKDIIKFHCVIWPALLLAVDLPLPKKVFAHGFFTINGQKISKSLGNAIDPVTLAEEYGADALRYFILRDIPFGADGDFSHQRLLDRYNADLANGLGNLVSRALNMMEQYGISPPDFAKASSGKPAPEGATPAVASGESRVGAVVDTHLKNLAFDKALEAIWQEIAQADELIEQKKPWELAKLSPPARGGDPAESGRGGGREELEGVLVGLYNSLCTVNTALAPFMPEAHAKLTDLLSARPLKKPAEPLFARKLKA